MGRRLPQPHRARQARGAKSFADFPTNETTLVQDLINLEDMGSSSRGKYAAGRSPARTYSSFRVLLRIRSRCNRSDCEYSL